MENIETKPAVQSALAKINDFDLQDFDILEQKLGMNGGNSAIVYFLIAVANIASFPVFAVYSLVAIPGTITLGLAVMVFRSLGRCKSEDLIAEKNFNAQNGDYVDVPSEEVSDEPVPQLNASAAQEILPGSNAPVGSRVAPTSPATVIQADTTIQADSPFVGNPFNSTGNPTPVPDQATPVATAEDVERAAYEAWADAEAAKSMDSMGVILLMPLKERAEYILDKLAAYGCDLWQYLYAPILGINGEQQSGKTTLCLIVAILEASYFGKHIHYVTVDGDIYPIRFASACSGHKFYQKAAEYINDFTKDSASGDIWVFDETSNASEVVPDAISLLWLKFLTGFKKSGATARLPLHGTTATAMGIPTGRNESAKREMTFIQAHLKREFIEPKDVRHHIKGGEYPSGRYSPLEFTNDKLEPIKDRQLVLPEWLQIENAPNGHPCYIRSLLKYFPELDSRVLNYTPPDMFEEPDTEKTDEPANNRPNINSGNEFVDYWSKKPAPSRPVSQESDPFAVEDSYQATESTKSKKRVKMTDVIPGTLAGTPKTYEQVMAQVSGWLRKEPGKWFTTSDLLSKFKGKKKISKDGEPDVFYTERNAIRKVISSIVIAMGKSPREAYEVIKDPEKGLTIRFPVEEEEDDEEMMVSIEF